MSHMNYKRKYTIDNKIRSLLHQKIDLQEK